MEFQTEVCAQTPNCSYYKKDGSLCLRPATEDQDIETNQMPYYNGKIVVITCRPAIGLNLIGFKSYGQAQKAQCDAFTLEPKREDQKIERIFTGDY